MGLPLGTNFELNAEKFNFERDSFATLAEMKAFPLSSVPDGFTAFCEQDFNHYVMCKGCNPSDETGYWRNISTVTDFFDNPVDEFNYSRPVAYGPWREDRMAIVGALTNKVDKVTGKGLSTNDYTTAEKQKLSSLTNYDDSAVVKSIKINGETKTPTAGLVDLGNVGGSGGASKVTELTDVSNASSASKDTILTANGDGTFSFTEQGGVDVANKADKNNYVKYTGSLRNGYFNSDGGFVSSNSFRAAEFSCIGMGVIYMNMGSSSTANRCLFVRDGVVMSSGTDINKTNREWVVPTDATECRISTETVNISSLGYSVQLEPVNPVMYEYNVKQAVREANSLIKNESVSYRSNPLAFAYTNGSLKNKLKAKKQVNIRRASYWMHCVKNGAPIYHDLLLEIVGELNIVVDITYNNLSISTRYGKSSNVLVSSYTRCMPLSINVNLIRMVVDVYFGKQVVLSHPIGEDIKTSYGYHDIYTCMPALSGSAGTHWCEFQQDGDISVSKRYTDYIPTIYNTYIERGLPVEIASDNIGEGTFITNSNGRVFYDINSEAVLPDATNANIAFMPNYDSSSEASCRCTLYAKIQLLSGELSFLSGAIYDEGLINEVSKTINIGQVCWVIVVGDSLYWTSSTSIKHTCTGATIKILDFAVSKNEVYMKCLPATLSGNEFIGELGATSNGNMLISSSEGIIMSSNSRIVGQIRSASDGMYIAQHSTFDDNTTALVWKKITP